MDRNTIIAVVLSVIVITVGMTIQTVFFAPEIDTTATEMTVESVDNSETTAQAGVSAQTGIYGTTFAPSPQKDAKQESFKVENEVMEITFDTAGASVSSIKLKDHLDDGEPVELIFRNESSDNAFLLYSGDNFNNPIKDVFSYNISNVGDITRVSFSSDFVSSTNEPFTIIKEYGISNKNEYLFQLAVTIKTKDGKSIPLNSNNYMYSVGFGPQVGPEFNQLSNYDYRRVYYKRTDKGSKNTASFKQNVFNYSDKQIDWVALSSKYFTVVTIPSQKLNYKLSAVQETGIDDTVKQENFYLVARPYENTASVTDVYSFYCGPQLSGNLNKYDIANDNVFGLSDLHLSKVLDTSSWLGWLETLLKWILNFFYRLIPNYGVAIILLTILIKLILQPLSKKGMDSTAKMSALQPKLTELQTKYKDNPEELNRAMGKLYKEEGINPMGSCLPMLIQFPIFIALYGLLQKHFELRGAMFIPGWIPDLSIPDTVAILPFSIPFLGNMVHILPILYTASMIFSMKITQNGAAAGSGQTAGMMKFMTYGMPLMFFFMLYNAPSGLLLYWSVMNLISILQQVFVNKKKKAVYAKEIEEKEKGKIKKFSPKKKK